MYFLSFLELSRNTYVWFICGFLKKIAPYGFFIAFSSSMVNTRVIHAHGILIGIHRLVYVNVTRVYNIHRLHVWISIVYY